jgi:hypothetical protein
MLSENIMHDCMKRLLRDVKVFRRREGERERGREEERKRGREEGERT